MLPPATSPLLLNGPYGVLKKPNPKVKVPPGHTHTLFQTFIHTHTFTHILPGWGPEIKFPPKKSSKNIFQILNDPKHKIHKNYGQLGLIFRRGRCPISQSSRIYPSNHQPGRIGDVGGPFRSTLWPIKCRRLPNSQAIKTRRMERGGGRNRGANE